MRCSVPTEIAAHKAATTKGDRRLHSTESAFVLRATGKLVQVGSRKLQSFYFGLNTISLEGWETRV